MTTLSSAHTRSCTHPHGTFARMNSSLSEGNPSSRAAGRSALSLALALASAGCPSPTATDDAAISTLDAARDDDDAFSPPADDTGPRRDGGNVGDAPATDDALSLDDAALDATASDDAASGDAGECTPLADEICNGVDDTCDAVVDEGCACRPGALVGTSDGFHAALARTNSGELVTAHEEFGVGYAVERHTTLFAPIGDSIELVSDDTRPSNDLSLFALGNDVGALWRQWPSSSVAADEPTFARVDAASASRAIGPISLAPGAGGPLGQSGTAFAGGFAVARVESAPLGSGVGIRIFDRAGVATLGPTPLLEDRSVGYTAIAATSEVVGVAYQASMGSDPFEVRFVRFDDHADVVGSSLSLGAGVRPRIAFSTTGAWGVIWEGSSGLMFASVDASGALDLAPRMIASGSARGASIVGEDEGGGWAIVHRTSTGTRFVRLDVAGGLVGESLSPAGFFVDGVDVLALDVDRFVTVGLTAGGGSAFWVPCER